MSSYKKKCIPLSVKIHERLFFGANNAGDPEKCWLWEGAKNPDRYGVFQINRKTLYAHRAMAELWHGEIPKRMHVCHRCNNPSCINPAHLYIGTAKQNGADRSKAVRRVKEKEMDMRIELLLGQGIYVTTNYDQALGLVWKNDKK